MPTAGPRLSPEKMDALAELGWHDPDAGHNLLAERDHYPPMPLDDIMPLDRELVENGTAVDLPVP